MTRPEDTTEAPELRERARLALWAVSRAARVAWPVIEA